MTQSFKIKGAPYPERRKRHAIIFYPRGMQALANGYRTGLRGRQLSKLRAGAARVQLYPHPSTVRWIEEFVEPAIAAARLTKIPKPAGVEVQMLFRLPRPASHMRSGRNAGRVKGSSPAHPVGSNTGDIDNLAKAIYDSLTGILWDDDSQVVRESISKVYADDGLEPGVDFQAVALPGTVSQRESED